MDRNVGVYDEGLILLGAQRVSEGAVPHRDFYANYGPGQFYVLAALFKGLGPSVLVERGWDTVVRVACVAFVWVIVNRLAPRGHAAAAAAASLAWLGSLDFYGYPVFPTLACALASLALLAPAFDNDAGAARLLTAGLCAGAAALFRYDVGVATFGAECLVLAVSGWFRRRVGVRRFAPVVRAVVLFTVGFAAVVVPVAFAFYRAGAIPDLVFDVVTYPGQNYMRMRSLPFPGPLTPGEGVGRYAVYLPIIACVASLAAIIAVVRRRGQDHTGSPGANWEPSNGIAVQWTLVALVLLTLAFIAKGYVRISRIHMAMALITSIALTAVMARPDLVRSRIGRGLVGCALVAAVFFTLLSLWTGLGVAVDNIAWASNPASWEVPATGLPRAAGTCRMPADLERLACFPTSPEMVETIRYVQQRTTLADPVFVGLSRHDKIVMNDVLMYFAMNRRPATKWYHFDPGLQTSVPIQQEMVAELQHAKPKLVVVEDNWADVVEPNDSAVSSGVTILDDYLRRAFEPVATFGRNTVLRPRSADHL